MKWFLIKHSAIFSGVMSVLVSVSHGWVDVLEPEIKQSFRNTKVEIAEYLGFQEAQAQISEDDARAIIAAVAEECGEPAHTLLGLTMTESRGERFAISPAGAIGLMQVMPANTKACGLKSLLELGDPWKNARCGCHIYKEEKKRFGDVFLALAAYNAGAGRVFEAQKKAGSRDFVALSKYLPSETQKYVPRAMNYILSDFEFTPERKKPEKRTYEPNKEQRSAWARWLKRELLLTSKSQADLAAYINRRQQTVSDWIIKETAPLDVETRRKVFEFFGLPPRETAEKIFP